MIYDVMFIGGGPAGYSGAEKAAHAGLKTVLFEKRSVGGVCLNEGCIPTKTYLYSAKIYNYALHGDKYGVTTTGAAIDHSVVAKRKDKVVKTLVGGIRAKLKALGVETVEAEAKITKKGSEGYVVTANGTEYVGKNIIICTGSEAIVPPIPGLREGLASGFVLTNREILDSQLKVPENLVVIGGGVIGLEMASYFNTVGSNVTVIEMLPKIGGPMDGEISDMLLKEYQKKGVKFLLGAKAAAVGNGAVEYEINGEKGSVKADKVLCSIGRRAVVQGLGLENIGVAFDRAIPTDEFGKTNVPNVYAAGDVNGKSMLAHTAYREVEVCINNILGKKDRMRYDAIPSVIYTNPEVASCGITEEGAKAAGMDYKVVKLSMRYSGRFVAENEGGDGLCKIIINKKYNSVAGVQMIGNPSSEIIYGAAMMIENEMRVDDVKEIVFPHPTVSEIIRETIFEYE